MTKKCSPHRWGEPEIGDASLECRACGFVLHFDDINPHMETGICTAQSRFGSDHAAQFADAFIGAFTSYVEMRRDQLRKN